MLTFRAAGTGNEWNSGGAARQCWKDPAAKAACSGARRSHNRPLGIPGEPARLGSGKPQP